MNDTPPSGKQSPGSPASNRWWHKDQLRKRLPALTVRGHVAVATRQFFAENGFVEVETPALQISPGMEPHLTAFSTQLFEPFEETNTRTLYLHTSPEFAMKKLLAGGMDKIFQLAKVWRNGDRSGTHHPEFTMLEWYRAGATWQEIAEDCEALVKNAVSQTHSVSESQQFSWQGAQCDPFGAWQYLSVAEAFENYCEIDLLATAPDPLKPDAALLAVEAKRVGVRIDSKDQWEEIFFRLFLEKIEPNLGVGVPTVLYNYPLSMAALARQSADDDRVAERFEIFVCGVELANGFGELTDVDEQRRRFEAEIAHKQEVVGYSYPIDEDFLDALAMGMPEASGIALGFDRLVMLCAGVNKIEDVLWAPVVTAC
ncbi:MAG: EF-P lysine aminoacylase GenX [Alphaproteobacteria bacterium]|nr:EF-P lysine aminoacylase GenX [Alphaproteobacteria bacterium]